MLDSVGSALFLVAQTLTFMVKMTWDFKQAFVNFACVRGRACMHACVFVSVWVLVR